VADPNSYSADDEEEAFVADCVEERQSEHPNEDPERSAAICLNIWAERISSDLQTRRRS
jgi:hypothetical protein